MTMRATSTATPGAGWFSFRYLSPFFRRGLAEDLYPATAELHLVCPQRVFRVYLY
jgi:hypothetical protein